MDTHMTPALAGSTGVDLRQYADHNSMMRESSEITKIAPALVRAQSVIENPPRNRTVQVRTQAGSYSFRYATLDKIGDTIRPALADNGLCVLQPIVATERGPALVTRLLHESGQWMECEIALPTLNNDPQRFGSAVTYLRRYAISAILNITSDEDDDGNGAAGNHVRDLVPARGRNGRLSGGEQGGANGNGPRSGGGTGQPGNRGAAGPARNDGADKGTPAEAAAQALVKQARVAETVDEGHALLERWTREGAALEGLRGTSAWEALEREMGAGLKRSLGTDPAAAYVSALRASDASHVSALQQHWEGRWADTLTAMQQEAPATYALLRRITAAQVARVRGKAAGTQEPKAEEAPRAGAAVPAGFEAQLRDETGELASDPIEDPVAFARAYADQWRATDEDARGQLARHNVKALAAAAKSAEARTVLDVLGNGRSPGGNGQAKANTAPREASVQQQPALSATRSAPRSRKEEKAPVSFWTILRPGKGSITPRNGDEWLAWWKEAAGKASREGAEREFQALYDANTAIWDEIATRSAEAHDVVEAAARAVRDALGG